ncbi:MAG: hypothetical protein ACKOSR_01450, partial [Flavobacteriales bacterium]
GLTMQIAMHGWKLVWEAWPLPVAVFIGSLLGSRWSSARFTHRIVRWVTIVIIIFAALRTLLKYL